MNAVILITYHMTEKTVASHAPISVSLGTLVVSCVERIAVIVRINSYTRLSVDVLWNFSVMKFKKSVKEAMNQNVKILLSLIHHM